MISFAENFKSQTAQTIENITLEAKKSLLSE